MDLSGVCCQGFTQTTALDSDDKVSPRTLMCGLRSDSCGVFPAAVGVQKQIIGLLEQALTCAPCYGAPRLDIFFHGLVDASAVDGRSRSAGSARVLESQIFRAANAERIVKSSNYRPTSAGQLVVFTSVAETNAAAPLCVMYASAAIPHSSLRLLSGKTGNFPECLELGATGFGLRRE